LPMTDTVSVAKLVAEAIAQCGEEPLALFGHSMGAGIAYETSLVLARMHGRAPLCLIASARRAPHLPARKPPIYLLPDDQFVEELKRLNGMPPGVLENQELMELLAPTLRADFRLAETYRSPTAVALQCPVIAFGGEDDPDVTISDLDAWREVGAKEFRLHMLPGDHFFINTNQRRVLDLVASELARVAK